MKAKAKANSKGAKIMQECNYKPQEYSRMKYRSYFLFNDLHLFFVWMFQRTRHLTTVYNF